MYNLKIKVGNVWHDADLPIDTSIAVTFEEAGMAETKAKCSGTQSIELPRTATNEKIFGCAAHDHVSATGQYRIYQCALLNDGVTLFDNKSRLTIISADDRSYSVVITGPTSDVFSKLEAINFEGDDKDALGYAYETDDTYTSTGGYTGATRQVHPIDKMIDKLAARIGYDMTAIKNAMKKMDSLEFISNIGMPWEDEFLIEANRETAKGLHLHLIKTDKRTAEPDQYDTTSWPSADFCIRIQLLLKTSVTSLPSHRFQIGMRCEESQDTSHIEQSPFLLFELSDMNLIDMGNGWKKATVVTRPTQGRREIAEGSVTSSTATWLFTLGDKLKIYRIGSWTVDWNTTQIYYDVLMPGEATENEDAITDQFCYIAQNVGYKNALDLIKAQMQMNGIITSVRDGQVIAYKYADIIANKSQAADWTDFVISFSKKYHDDKMAKKNIVRLKANNETGIEDTAYFEVDDETLKPQADYLSLNAESKKTRYSVGSNPKAPVIHTAYWMDQQQTFGYFEILSAAEIVTRYGAFVSAMQEYKLVSAKMLIPVTAILNFDHRMPIYLRQLGRYCYVRKITNWIADRPCDVELLQLPYDE